MPSLTLLETHPQHAIGETSVLEERYRTSRAEEEPLKAEAETRIWSAQEANGCTHFYKEYRIPPSRRLFSGAARSRALREYRALLAMDLAELPVAQPQWFGELRRGPILEYSVLVTLGLGAVQPLPDWLRAHPDPETALRLCRSLGAIARSLHEKGFGHFRMQAKNFMVRSNASGPTLHMIDAPYTCRWPQAVADRIRAVDLEDLCGTHSVFQADQIQAVMDGYRADPPESTHPTATPADVLQGYHPGSRGRWGQKLRRIAYYLGAIWSGHRP